MCCTAASVMIDQRLGGNYNGATRRDYLLFDEADQLPGAAALQRDLEITPGELAAAGIRSTDVRDCLDRLRRDENAEPELRAKAMIALEALDEPAWYQSVGFNDDGGITLYHRLPGRLLKRISNESRSAFISATLSISGRFDDFRRSMGIGETSKLSSIIEPERHGEITVETPTGESVAEVLKRAEKPCLCVTPSFALANEISRQVSEAVVRLEGETAFDAASRVGSDGILVAAGAWAGLDTPIRWASIVVPRIPFERPTIIDDKVESSYLDSRNVAIRRMRQVVGRGLRSPDARCSIYILDDRIKQLGNFLPERFSQSWREGARTEVILSKAERDKAYRRAVLKKHGAVCKACGMIPKVEMQIEVHHLDPISEGERNTTLEDLVPLCANCHRLAHSERPPIPMDRLRTINSES
jgi:Rad3-related DNA helicase